MIMQQQAGHNKEWHTPCGPKYPSKTSMTNHNIRHQEPINTNIMNMNENNPQEKRSENI